MKFTSYSFTFIFIFCFVLLLCTALQAELVQSYDSDKDMTTINTKPTQIMKLNPWKQPRLSITIQYRGRNKPPPEDLAELKVKMSFISLSRERKFDNYEVIQFYADGRLVFQRKFKLQTKVWERSVMETLTVIVPYDELELMIAQHMEINVCDEPKFEKLRMCTGEIEIPEREREDILGVRELIR
jgi:hypothetical protein